MTQTTAKIIEEQLGNKTLTMIGAKNLVGYNDSLTMHIGRSPKGVTHIKITLTDVDLYNIKFYRVRGVNITTLAELTGIYFDQLNDAIELNTGLRTRL